MKSVHCIPPVWCTLRSDYWYNVAFDFIDWKAFSKMHIYSLLKHGITVIWQNGLSENLSNYCIFVLITALITGKWIINSKRSKIATMIWFFTRVLNLGEIVISSTFCIYYLSLVSQIGNWHKKHSYLEKFSESPNISSFKNFWP